MILVFGANGAVGRALVAALGRTGEPFRCAVRDADKARRSLPCGTDIMVADLGRPETVDAALVGATRLFLASSDEPQMAEWQITAIDAAQRAGVERIVKLSCLIGESAAHRAVEDHLAATGLAWTVLRPCYLMQNLLQTAGMVRAESRLLLPFAGDAPMAMIDAGDVAAMALKALREDGHAGRAYCLAGAADTHAHFATLLFGALDRPVAYVQVDSDRFRQSMERRGEPEWRIDRQLAIAAAANAGALEGASDDFERLIGEPPRSLAKFLSYNVITFED